MEIYRTKPGDTLSGVFSIELEGAGWSLTCQLRENLGKKIADAAVTFAEDVALPGTWVGTVLFSDAQMNALPRPAAPDQIITVFMDLRFARSGAVRKTTTIPVIVEWDATRGD